MFGIVPLLEIMRNQTLHSTLSTTFASVSCPQAIIPKAG
jgi:hypothetical protein